MGFPTRHRSWGEGRPFSFEFTNKNHKIHEQTRCPKHNEADTTMRIVKAQGHQLLKENLKDK